MRKRKSKTAAKSPLVRKFRRLFVEIASLIKWGNTRPYPAGRSDAEHLLQLSDGGADRQSPALSVDETKQVVDLQPGVRRGDYRLER
ncbi:MAG: hypothetical protein KDA61_08490 [Planctomycetales bacterium]|nr:hypothetical protein [Planctomycetales bacterium]